MLARLFALSGGASPLRAGVRARTRPALAGASSRWLLSTSASDSSPAPSRKAPQTPLGEYLHETIGMRGAVSVATFIRELLGNARYGYYATRAASRVFGGRGDFTTAPEISQMFCEVLGLWVADTWERLGCPPAFRLVELGPGKGTLMAQMLRVFRGIPTVEAAVHVHLVDIGRELIKHQRTVLGCTTRPLPFAPPGSAAAAGAPAATRHQQQHRAAAAVSAASARDPRPGGKPLGADEVVVLRRPSMNNNNNDDDEQQEETQAERELRELYEPPARRQFVVPPAASGRGRRDIPIAWHPSFSMVPDDLPTIVIAQEFFDALPVHIFEYTSKGWREVLVDIDEDEASPYHFKFVLSPAATLASVSMLRDHSVAPGSKAPSVGDRIEVCAEGMAVVGSIASRINKHTGAALLIDYGENMALSDSVRSIKGHKYQHILAEPGEADVSALVDFASLRRMAESEPGVRAFGPVTQGELLRALGIQARLAMLLRDEFDEGKADELFTAYERLTHESQMGKTYKALALLRLPERAVVVAPEGTSQHVAPPAGFELTT